MKKIKVIILAIVIIILGVVIMNVFTGMQKDQEPSNIVEDIKYVISDSVQYSANKAEITTFGKVRSFNKIEVYSEVSGIVLNNSPRFKVGNYFKFGQTMIKIDDREARLNLYAQKSDFLSILTRTIPDIKADFTSSYDKWNEYLENFEIEEELKPLPEPESSKEKYFLSSRNIYKLYYSLKNIEIRLDKYEIKAPFNGYVTQSLVEVGTSIKMGQKLGEFSGINNFELELSVSKNELPFVSVGDKVAVSDEGHSNQWQGKVSRISENIDPPTQTLKVYVPLNGNKLFDGMYLKGKILGKNIDSTYKINRKAIVNNEYVYVIKDSLLDKTPVDILFADNNFAYIRGVKPNTIIITEQLVNTPLGTKVIPVIK